MATTIASATTEGYDLETRAKMNLKVLSSASSYVPSSQVASVLGATAQAQGIDPNTFATYIQNANSGKGTDVEFNTILEVTSAALSQLNVGGSQVATLSPPNSTPFSNTTTMTMDAVTIKADPNQTENSWENILQDLNQANPTSSVPLDPSDPNTGSMNLNSIFSPGQSASGGMYKVFPTGTTFKEIEIYPSLAKPSETNPFLIKMLDKDFKNAGIYVNSDLIVWGISLTPTPNTFSISSAKLINRYQTMTRWVEEHWGDDLDTVSFSGSTFSFFAYNLGNTPDIGLTTQYRNNTAAYQILRELQNIFRYNGMIFQDDSTYDGLLNPGIPQSGSSEKDTINPVDNFLENDTYFKTHHPLTGLAKERLYINIYFDYVSFLGYFESFDVVEEADKPYQFNYSAVFKSEKTKWHQGYLATDSVG